MKNKKFSWSTIFDDAFSYVVIFTSAFCIICMYAAIFNQYADTLKSLFLCLGITMALYAFGLLFALLVFAAQILWKLIMGWINLGNNGKKEH